SYECWYAYFYNNTLHDCGEASGAIFTHHADPPTTGDGGSRNLFFFNNVFLDTDGDMPIYVKDQSGKPYENWQNDNNNFYNAGNAIPTGGLFDPNQQANSTFGNPNLANPTGTATTYAGWLDCYRITASSAALIDQGNSNAGNTPQPAVLYDIEGTSRPQGSGWDIGAFEYVGGPAPPVANFSGNPTQGPPPLTVYFSDTSSGSPTSWSWTFGDSGTSPDQHPSHEYTAENLYTVSLTAYNAEGQDTETKIDYIDVSTGPVQSCHVGAIDMFSAGPPNYKGGATITVHDQDCAALVGVTVDITWTGAAPGTDSDVTDENGQVTFTSDRNKAGGTYTCCVDDLTKTGYPYESGDNHETCDAITLP
ncbi:MAG: PKD domain-containing protein, partial [Proteobacteria bacterium]|nr:PKD domain-containing protein [Pseudomonadota bacterium]